MFCPTAIDAQRVPSFDGVPLDVDVTLPPSGDGPFPTIVMMHGWGGNKARLRGHVDSEAATTTSSSRSRATRWSTLGARVRPLLRHAGLAHEPGCDAGWIHLADHRYESRDTQHLLGLLVDQGVIEPSALGVTGISYGGIQSLNLARLRDRIRLPDGSLPALGEPERHAAQDRRRLRTLGRLRPHLRASAQRSLPRLQPLRAGQSITPGGVLKKSYNNGLYLSGNVAGFYAPTGGAFSADITRWKALADRGEPARADALAVGRELTGFHSSAGLTGPERAAARPERLDGRSVPRPRGAACVPHVPGCARRAYLASARRTSGIPRGTNNPASDRRLQRQGSASSRRSSRARARRPRNGSVIAYTQTCPRDRAGRRPLPGPRAGSALHPRTAAMRHRGRCG